MIRSSIRLLSFCAVFTYVPMLFAQTEKQDLASLQKSIAQLVPVPIKTELSTLPISEQQALNKLIKAAHLMDTLFLRQVSANNESLQAELTKRIQTAPKGTDAQALAQAQLDYFLINKGPWCRINHNKPFIPNVGDKKKQGNFYPEDATQEEIETWLKTLSEQDKAQAMSFYTVVKRNPKGQLMVVPYATEYATELKEAATLLEQAAALTQNASLQKFLKTRAQAFLSNDYYSSDLAWMELDSDIEPVIGPYEVYEDEWFNAKAAFEAFITVTDQAETKKLVQFSSYLQDIENHLPIDKKYKNPALGKQAPIRVVNVVYNAGDANRGVQTAAYNLPNQERVIQEKGSKRVMLKNIQEAKYNKTLLPIAKIALPESSQKNISFNAFFSAILMHELMHGLGPHHVYQKQTTVRESLKETYSAIEEAKADISGLFALQYLMDKGVIDKTMAPLFYETFLASTFRTVRFGTSEAHGKGMALQLNFLLQDKSITINKQGQFSINYQRIKKAVEKLTQILMTIQAQGQYQQAKQMLDTMGHVTPAIQQVLDKLTQVPVDIHPEFIIQ